MNTKYWVAFSSIEEIDSKFIIALFNHFGDIKKYASVIENRLNDEYCTLDTVLEDNANYLSLALKYKVNYILIDDKYEIDIKL